MKPDTALSFLCTHKNKVYISVAVAMPYVLLVIDIAYFNFSKHITELTQTYPAFCQWLLSILPYLAAVFLTLLPTNATLGQKLGWAVGITAITMPTLLIAGIYLGCILKDLCP